MTNDFAADQVTSQLVGQERSTLGRVTKTLQIGTVAFLPGARCTEELQGTQPEYKTNRVKMNQEIVQNSILALQESWRL